VTTRTYAPWVEPAAAKLAEGRRLIVETARRMPADVWERPSPLEGWTYKDLLAHLAAGDWAFQKGLRIILAGEKLRVAELGDVDETNARNGAERAGRSIDELIAEVEEEGEESQELLAQLTDAHESYKPEDAPVTLSGYLELFPGHDRAHLDQLRTAAGTGNQEPGTGTRNATRTYAGWVEPIATGFRDERNAVIEFARTAPESFWDEPSSAKGWTNKDLLAHIAAGTEKQFQAILRAVINRTRLDPALFGNSEVVNARDVEKRRGWTAEQVIEELEADRDEIDGLLAQLTDEHASLRQKDFELSLADGLRIFAPHEREHLEQLRAVVGAGN
jgi:uncharacterized protein (TIGR03083 family)